MMASQPAMLVRSLPEQRYPVEFLWLVALAFFLPLFEAPKNLCWAGYVLTWLVNRARARDWGGAWDRWDTLIALWIASAYVVAAFAGVHHDEWGEAHDVLRYGSVLWLVKRSRYEERSLLWVLGTIIAGTLVTLGWSYWRLYVTKTKVWLELNSVGYFNHSAIYMTIVLGVALSMTLAYWPRLAAAARIGLGLAVAALLASVFVSESRAAAVAAVLLVFAVVGTLGVGSRVGVRLRLLVAALGVAVVLAGAPGLVDKFVTRSQYGMPLAFRDSIWSNALIEWRQFPIFGVGMGNFGRIPLAQLEQWSKSQEWDVRATAEGVNTHAHSLYFTALAERGLAGFAVLVAVLCAWGVSLWRGMPRAQDPPRERTLFGAALSAWLVSVTVGIVNTTLHHEHGILAVLLLGLWLGRRTAPVDRARRQP